MTQMPDTSPPSFVVETAVKYYNALYMVYPNKKPYLVAKCAGHDTMLEAIGCADILRHIPIVEMHLALSTATGGINHFVIMKETLECLEEA